MDIRSTLTSLGFTESGGDMEEIWTSPRSPSGVWFEVTFEDVFSGTTTQWSRHTVLVAQVIEPPATELEVRALLERWGIATKGQDSGTSPAWFDPD